MVTIFRLMRSGDWTIRERVDNTTSESTDISFRITSCVRSVRKIGREGYGGNDLALALLGLLLFDLLTLLRKLVVKLFEHQ